MYQSDVQRFERSKNTDLFVTFFPLVLAFGLRGFLLKTGLPEAALFAAQALLAVFLAAAFLLSHHCYFRLFRYTVAERGGSGYPAESLTFERLCGKKSRIYERVLRGEMLYLAAPDERCAAYGKPSASYRLTVLPSRSACRLNNRQEGTLYCAAFHPDERQAAVLRRWTGQDKAENRPEAAGSC